MTDEELYQRYLDNDTAAADLLVQIHSDALMLYINGYLHDIHESEDLMIEAFARLFARPCPIREAGCFRAYLYKIGRNLALRHQRRRRLHLILFDDLPFELSGGALAETPFFENERRHQLYDALAKLKPEYREALYLVYFEDMSYHMAAQVMNKNERQITNLIYRGKQSLKAILEKEGFQYADK